MARKRKGRSVNGILVLDKPTGITSNRALQKVKRLFNAQKAGHTGSLDPLATGVLPICLGEATKISHYLLDSDKRYRAKCLLGSVTTTGDSDGDIIEQKPVPNLNQDELLALLSSFEGLQEQTPPMYSALKHNGRPLYEYARKGIVIERKSRPITLFEIKLLDFSMSTVKSQPAFIEIEVQCSKGTYIRTLCEDIGHKIGCGAHIGALRRVDSGPFSLSQAISLDDLLDNFGSNKTAGGQACEILDNGNRPSETCSDGSLAFEKMDQLLLPTDTAIAQFPAIEINEAQYIRIQHGMTIDVQPLSEARVEAGVEAKVVASDYRLYYHKTLIGLAILDEQQKLKPKRLLFL